MQLSFPHFLFAPERQSEVIGVTPNIDDHLGYLDVNRRLGAPLFARIAIQANVLVEPISSVPLLRNVPNVVLPVFWMRQGIQLPFLLEYGGGFAFNMVEYGSILGLLGGIIGATLSGWGVYKSRKNERNVLTNNS